MSQNDDDAGPRPPWWVLLPLFAVILVLAFAPAWWLS